MNSAVTASDAPLSSASGPSAATFGPALILKRLEALAKAPQPSSQATELAWGSIRQEPDLFQPRPFDERHIGDLVRAIGLVGKLDPVTVIQAGSVAILIEGHHRMAAYHRAGVKDGIPVHYFAGDLHAAVLESGSANSKAKLPMSNSDRQDCAWRWVQLRLHSRSQIAGAAGVSTGQIAIMRRVFKELGQAALDPKSWKEAQRAAMGVEGFTWNEDEVEARKEAQAQAYATRMSKEFGTKLSNNPEIAARALALHFGQRLGEVYRELGDHVDEPEDVGGDF